MARKLSYADLQTEKDRLATRDHILGIAVTEQADAVYRHRDGRDVYTWSVYRIAGHAGGYLIGIYRGFVNRHASVLYVEHLDTAAQQVSERYSSFADCGMSAAVEEFLRKRYNAQRAA